VPETRPAPTPAPAPAPAQVDNTAEQARSALRRGESALSSGDRSAARTAFEEAIELDDSLSAAHAGLGDVFFQERNYAQASRHHLRATRLSSRNAEYHRKLGMDYFRLNNLEAALSSFERAVELGDSEAERFVGIVRERLAGGE
jgi:tetratricopeptide (TPR) repeat protein